MVMAVRSKTTNSDDEEGWANRAAFQAWENWLRKGRKQIMVGGLPDIKACNSPVVVIIEESPII